MKDMLAIGTWLVVTLGFVLLLWDVFKLINALTAYLKFKTQPSTTTIILKNEAAPKDNGNR